MSLVGSSLGLRIEFHRDAWYITKLELDVNVI
jgi:hypothetical protein